MFVLYLVIAAALASGITALLVNIFQHKQEAKNPYLRFVEVTPETTDPQAWRKNWPRQYDGYSRTVEATRTNFGGGDVNPAQKSDVFPWLTRIFAGYAFAIDYHDRRGHQYMLFDQETTKRVTERPQPGACLHCHASVIPTYKRLGKGDVQAGFVELTAMPYQQAHEEVVKTGSLNPTWNGASQEMKHADGAHPVSCPDCHASDTMELQVTRPGFINGIRALAASSAPVPHLASIERWRAGDRKTPYDPNRDATRQELRSFVCGQCHVEYYCGPKVTLFFPWNNGLRVEDIEGYYEQYKFPDGHKFYDWQHADTGAEILKAQHPEFETWSQGIHARSGVACADCHMPYMREGAMKVSDHWVRSPLLNVARACQTCHHYAETEIRARVDSIQQRNLGLLQRAGTAVVALIDGIKTAKAKGASPADLAPALDLHRKAQWRLDFVAAENSMGFHAPQETARILGEAIDYARQGELVTARTK
ncbi:MAG: ammonia-forming cytochrome c nitrite reductase subunit c552 [Polyangiaceae bacterium]